MITSKAIVSTLVMVLLLAGSARAGELFTPALNEGKLLGASIDCALLNISGVSGSVRIRVVDESGNTLGDSGSLTVPSGSVKHFSAPTGPPTSLGFHYCHFTVFPTYYLGVTQPFRTTITLFSSSGPVVVLSGDTVSDGGL